jgi:membrane fusion protein (multidrug efflux system)
LIAGAVLLLGALGWGIYWLLLQRHYESTDDAYVAADIVQINSLVPSTVIAVHADDTQTVQQGELLVELDPSDAAIGVASAESELAQAVRSVSAQYAREAQLRSELALRQLSLERAQHDLQRRLPLAEEGAVSAEEVTHARDTVAELSAAVAAAQSELNGLQAQVRGTTVTTHPQVLHAAAALRNAALAMRRTHLYAPVTGIVAKRSVQIGQRIVPAAPLMALVPLQDAWIDANLREVQLERIRVGQPAAITADIYGSDIKYHGRVAGLAAGSGSAFALLPAQNASGNWIKIVQRVPVRISIDPAELLAHPLRVGTSTHVRIDVGDLSGPVVSSTVRRTPQETLTVSDDPEVATRIQQIIAANSHASGTGTPRSRQ